MKFSIIAFTALAILPAAMASPGKTVGFQQVSVPDPEGKPIAMAIWYPSDAPAADSPLGMFSQFVATNAPLAGKQLPLILISHGTSGSFASHFDTALALAKAGFVAAAITHTGDSFADQSYTGNQINLIDRPRQIRVALDYLLESWKDHAQLDSERIGMFGFSLGGFTTLVMIGGTPDLTQTAKLCATRPDAPECTFVKRRHGDQLEPVAVAPVWVHDERIKAAVIAAPAVGFLFEGGGLKQVSVAVELWCASNDQQAPDAWNSGMVRKELPKPPEEHAVPGVDHFVFLAPCSEALAKAAPAICQDPSGFSRKEFHVSFNRTVVAFFSRELKH